VNISSVHAFVSYAGCAAYDATKAGLLGLTRAMALDHGAEGIRVNAICPGYIDTPLMERWLESLPDREATMRQVLAAHPMGRMGTPRDIAEAALFLASDAASFISGTSLVVDGAIGVTGGVGIGREWLTGVQKLERSRWRDTSVRIDGPAATDMANAFENMWRRVLGGERRGSHRFLRRRGHGAHLDPATHEPALVGIVEGEPLRRLLPDAGKPGEEHRQPGDRVGRLHVRESFRGTSTSARPPECPQCRGRWRTGRRSGRADGRRRRRHRSCRRWRSRGNPARRNDLAQ